MPWQKYCMRDPMYFFSLFLVKIFKTVLFSFKWEGLYHFSTIQAIDYHFRFFKYQFYVVLNFTTNFRIKSQAPKF